MVDKKKDNIASVKRGINRMASIIILIAMVVLVTLMLAPMVSSDLNELLTSYKVFYISCLAAIFLILLLIYFIFPKRYSEARKLAMTKMYDDSDLNVEVPKKVWLSLLGTFVMLVAITWILIK